MGTATKKIVEVLVDYHPGLSWGRPLRHPPPGRLREPEDDRHPNDRQQRDEGDDLKVFAAEVVVPILPPVLIDEVCSDDAEDAKDQEDKDSSGVMMAIVYLRFAAEDSLAVSTVQRRNQPSPLRPAKAR